jgi:DNA repair protein RecN (Recombination protein N)
VLSEVDDVVAEVRQLAESIDESPERLESIRERRQLLKNLCRKYGDDLAAVMAFHAETQERLDELEQFDARAAALDHEREQALLDELEAARTVGKSRRRAAPELAAAVQSALRELALPHAEIAVQVGATDDDNPGDHVTFLLAANPGSPLLPLTRVASGGELARTMLALRLTLSAAKSGGPAPGMTLVFDEVDAGIGGTAATAVGAALARLGDDAQVLVVTHLAQVAALASTQYVVDKTVKRGATTVSASLVTGDERVAEIARMLSGSDSQSARQHAQELLA